MSGTPADLESFKDNPYSPSNVPNAFDQIWGIIKIILSPIASLKLTVVLFGLSIVLIFVGTLAQYELNMWQVIDKYFQSFFVWVPLKVFTPKSFFPNIDNPMPGGFWMPGGVTLGIGLAANLAAAHLVRFNAQARGRRLLTGLGVMAMGIFVTTLVVLGGDSSDGLQGSPLVSWDVLWWLILVAVAATALGFVVLLITVDRSRKVEILGLVVGTIVFGALAVYMLSRGSGERVSDPSMRILWQLIQGFIAGLILLIGAVMVFKRRGGIVVIHLGVGLLMFGELLVGNYAVEEQIAIAEGQTLSFARDTRSVELAVIDRSPTDHDDVVVVPGDIIQRALANGEAIKSDLLPFDIKVEEFMNHCEIRPPADGDVNPATAGTGRTFLIDPARAAGGAESGGETNIAGMYATITPKDDPNGGDTYLLAQQFGDSDILTATGMQPIPEKIRVGPKFYDVVLRYQRNYKPYEITLNDVRKEDYLGTSTPRDYSSYISMKDPSRDFYKEKIRVWMNNPLRYAGETFYQSGYVQRSDGSEVSTLQVVTNTGWMIPYVACMLAFVGLLYHFAQTLSRFISRQWNSAAMPAVVDESRAAALAGKTSTNPFSDEALASRGAAKRKEKTTVSKDTNVPAEKASVWAIVVPILAAGICILYVGSKVTKKEIDHEGMRLDRFADIPIVYGGRVKPIDTLARNTLRTVSDKQVLRVPKKDDDWSKTRKESAMVWLLDTMTQADAGREHRVFRIDNLDVIESLSLERRKGFRYSVSELSEGIENFEAECKQARRVAADDTSRLTYQQRKLLETDKRLRAFTKIQSSFLPIPFPAMPTEEERKENPEAAKATMQEIARRMASVPQLNEALLSMQPPLIVPMSHGDDAWQPFASAANTAFLQRIMSGANADRRVIRWSEILDAYTRENPKDFNRAVTAYLKDIKKDPPKDYDPKKIAFERQFNDIQPFYLGMVLYVLAGLVTISSWMFWFRPLRRAGMAILLVTLVVHTVALLARIYISGRPPVTNLYSSAVFIGWGGAAAGLVIEAILKNGFGNILSSVLGFSTLFIAHQLAFGGDTFTVLQAVLDTQFWLATHVVCITLGYMATFVAGLLAILYIFAAVFVPKFDERSLKEVGRLVYGAVCFAIFLSFIGTVLGGLWADDSWGRFWGWDPKENGALMIVLWNALILHARWGKMVADRGTAVLAVFGNIVTAWSWFGVNELGIGLHSYGFTEGVLPALFTFATLMAGVIAVGCLPKSLWLSGRSDVA